MWRHSNRGKELEWTEVDEEKGIGRMEVAELRV